MDAAAGRSVATPRQLRASARCAERLDPRDRRVARPDRQRAVEVDDDQQRRPCAATRCVERRRDLGRRSTIGRRRSAGRGHGVTSTPGMIVCRPRAMMSGPIPPSAPSRMTPSLSIQKWTGRATASQRGGARCRRCRARAGRWRPSCSAKAATTPSSSLTSMARTTSPSSRVAGREAVHERELVDARRAVGPHEVDPDRLPAQVREVDRRRRRPGARPAPGPARRRGTAGRRSPEAMPRPTATDAPEAPRADADASATGTAARPSDADGCGRGRRRGAGLGGEGEDPPEDQRAAATPASRPATIERRGHMLARRVPVPTARRRAARATATMPAPMAGPTEQIRTRVLPALLTAFGVTLLAAGLLTYTAPVARGVRRPRPDRHRPSPRSRSPRRRRPLITLPPIGTAAPTPSERGAHAADPTASRRGSGSPRSTSTCRSFAGTAGYPLLQRGDVPARQLSQPGAGPGDVPVRARPRGHVPAAARDEGPRPARASSSRSGPATTGSSCTGSSRSAATRRPGRPRLTRPPRRPSSSGCRPREGPNGTFGKTQVIAEPLSVERPPNHDDGQSRRRSPVAAAEPGRPRPRSSRSGAGRRRRRRQPPTMSAGDDPEAGCLRPSTAAGLAHPEDAGDRADAGEDDRHAGQPLHDHRQVVVDLGEVHVERRRTRARGSCPSRRSAG